MKRPIYIKQHEYHPVERPSTFWYTVSRGGEPILTSETYKERSKAIRAARGTIDLLDPKFSVVFSYWTGRVGEMVMRTERR